MVDPILNMIFCYFLHYFIHLLTKKYAKSWFSVENLISTSEWHAQHPFAGQNTYFRLAFDLRNVVAYYYVGHVMS